ncbi:hypothetical protein ACFE04_029577 [Oxalis oulophora]
MVSLRRRRLLALNSGKSLPFPENSTQNGKYVNVQSMLSAAANLSAVKTIAKEVPGSSNVSGSSSSKEQRNQTFSGLPIKHRKRHRRKQHQNQEVCLMRGVYFKNMKWQAAIKVDKKQIHLGTVGSQEEAARLYDRAAFMCGREPNFEISEQEKQELKKFKWDEFLAYTRRGINNKKYKRRVGIGAGMQTRFDPLLQDGELENKPGENGYSVYDEVGQDSSFS